MSNENGQFKRVIRTVGITLTLISSINYGLNTNVTTDENRWGVTKCH